MKVIKNGKICTEDRWGLTHDEYMELVDEHKKARATMELIENHLEDINYHPECDALCKGDYERAIKLWDEEGEQDE